MQEIQEADLIEFLDIEEHIPVEYKDPNRSYIGSATRVQENSYDLEYSAIRI